MKNITMLLTAGLLSLTLIGCTQSEQAKENLEKADGRSEDAPGEEIVVGGFEVEGPEGRKIEVPEARVEREAAEEYLGEVQPVVESTTQDLSRVIEPRARLEDQTLTLSIEVQSVERAQQTAQEGLQELRGIQPPEDLEPLHEQLVNAYEEVLPAYDNVIEAFRGEDVGTLTAAVQESLPEIERASAEARSILQELQRAEMQGQ